MQLHISHKLLISYSLLPLLCNAVPTRTQNLRSVNICDSSGAPAPPQKKLDNVRTAFVSLPDAPFCVVYATEQKDVAFVTTPETFVVLNIANLEPKVVHKITFPDELKNDEGDGLGMALTNDGQDLVIAAGSGAYIADTAHLAAGQDGVVATLNGNTTKTTPGNSAIGVTLSLHDQYAFVSQEYGPSGENPGAIQVFKLSRSHLDGNVSVASIGWTTKGLESDVAGSVLSPDGKTLYVTSQGFLNPEVHRGSITLFDVETLKCHPAKALIRTIHVGCGADRIILSSDGSTAWITARHQNELQAWDTVKLLSDPNNALVASVTVGTAPVDVTFVKGESRILTADSNRFDVTGAISGISVVDVKAALAGKGKDSVLGRVRIAVG